MSSSRTYRNLVLVLLLGMAISAVSSMAVFSQRQTRLQGALDGFPDPPQAPERIPVLGVNVELTQYDEDELIENLNLIQETGFVWVRQVFAWDEVEPEPGEYDWSQYDVMVDEATKRDLRVVAVLWRSPVWVADIPTAPPSNLDQFAEFAGLVAERYGDRIQVYQIWDEPNLSSGWGNQRPDAVAYARLLEAGYLAIHAADPDAMVLTAGLAPTIERGPDNLNDILFLRALYENGAGDFFDGVAGKPYGFDTGPDDRRVNENLLNFSRFLLLREEMVVHGDTQKPLWASHFGWNALPEGWDGLPSMWGLTSPEQQAEWIIGAYERSLTEWEWTGALILENWQPNADQNDSHWGFALREPTGELTLTAEQIREKSELYNSAMWPGYYPADTRLADYGGDWEFSELGADIVENGDSAVELITAGERIGVLARRDNYRAYLYVEVEGQPSASLPQDERGSYAVLTSADYQPHVQIIPLANRLAAGEEHEIRIEADRGWDQWAVVGYVVGNDIDTTVYDSLIGGLLLVMIGCVAGVGVLSQRADWPVRLRRTAEWLNQRVDQGVHLALAFVATLAMWVGLALTWGGFVPNVIKRLGEMPSLAITVLTAGVFYFSDWVILAVIAALVLFVLIYARLSIGLALIMFFAPYYLLPRELFDKALSLVEVVSLLTLLAWLIHLIAERREKGSPSLRQFYEGMTSLDKAVSLFVGVAIASIAWAELTGVAITELRQMILEPLVVYLVLRTVPMSRTERWRIVDLLILTGAIVSLIGFYDLATGADVIRAEQGAIRLRSVFGTPNNLALFVGRLIPMTAAVVLIDRNTVRRILYGLAGVLMIGSAVLTFSKGGLLIGIPAGLALVVILWAGKAGLIAVGGGIVALLIALIPLSRHPRFQSLFEFEEGSSFFRVQLWQSALRMIGDHPITGVGLDQFLYQYRSKYILPSAWQQPDLSQPHNFLLNYWVRLGIVGLAAAVWMQVAFWRLGWRVQQAFRDRDVALRAMAVGLMGGMANFIGHGLVDEVHFVIDLAFIFFMTLGLMHQLAESIDESGD